MIQEPWPHERIAGEALFQSLAQHASCLSGKVLDVGSGSSPYEKLLGPDATWYRLDLSSDGAHVRSDAQRLPFRTGSFDGIVCTQVIEHLERPDVAFDEFARVLRVDGLLVVSAPQAWELHEIPRDFWRFTRFGLEQLFAQSGLEILSLTPSGGAIATAAQILCSSLGRGGQRLRLVKALATLGTWLDRRYPDPNHPLDYIVKARRC